VYGTLTPILLTITGAKMNILILRFLIGLGLLLPFSAPAFALSCAIYSVEEEFINYQDAPSLYRVGYGRFTEKTVLTETVLNPDLQPKLQGVRRKVSLRFVGVFGTSMGFTTPVDLWVTGIEQDDPILMVTTFFQLNQDRVIYVLDQGKNLFLQDNFCGPTNFDTNLEYRAKVEACLKNVAACRRRAAKFADEAY
jgi:hypothetical protein